MSDLRIIKEERLRQVNHATYHMEQHMLLLLNTVKQYTEELCHNRAADDVRREKHLLQERTNELFKLDDMLHVGISCCIVLVIGWCW